MTLSQNTVSFLIQNRLENSRDWFNTHKQEYKIQVEAPLLQLSAALGEFVHTIDPAMVVEPKKTLSRVWRDVRFSKDKTIYRDNMWMAFHRGKGMAYPTYFFEISPQNYRYGCGYYNAPSKVMDIVKKLVLENDKRYLDAQKALDSLPQFLLTGDRYKRPRYPNETAKKQEWLERRELSVIFTDKDSSVLFSETLADTIGNCFVKLAPFYNLLLDAHMQLADQLPEE